MDVTERVLMATNKAPEGWHQKVGLAEYAALDEERKKYYNPLFAKYRTKKVRDYDPDYGHFVGWRPIQVGVGEPIGYEYVGYLPAKAIDAILNSNVLMERVLRG